jgi:hypothetical protein
VTIHIGLDFDEPIYPWYDLAHEASIRAGIALPEHEPTSWAPHETYGCTLEEWVAVLDNEVLNGSMYRQDIDPDIIDAIRKAYRLGYGIHILTARGSFGELGEEIKRITRSEIIRQGIPYNSLNFGKDKVPTAKALGLDYMLDDAPHNYLPLLEAGINTYLLDERWNRDLPEPWVEDGGRRVHSTVEFLDHIIKHHGDQYDYKRPQMVP